MSIIEEREGKQWNSLTEDYESIEPDPEPLRKIDLKEAVYGETWEEIKEAAAYAPTRFEYFAGLALQGLTVGRAEKDLKTAVRKAIDLAKEMERQIDKAQSG